MQQKKLIIILADISGYTRFMLGTLTAAVHGQMVINTLIESLIEQVDIPLVLQEIEGDAVFLYAAQADADADWEKIAREVSEKLGNFFAAFIKTAARFMESTPCGCEFCINADLLGLKIVVHAGEAMFHEVAGRAQVSGPDVILAHRLLKNSVETSEYLLLSQAAFDLMGKHLTGEFKAHQESYEGFDHVDVHVRLLEEDFLRERDAVYALSADEMSAEVDRYFDWAVEHIGQATSDQLASPVTQFSWVQKMQVRAEALLAKIVARLHFRRAVKGKMYARGKRRQFVH